MKGTKIWMASMMVVCCMGVQAQETKEMVYPQAEWSKGRKSDSLPSERNGSEWE